MKSKKKTKLDYEIRRNRRQTATELAGEIVDALGITVPPVDPFEIAAREGRLLRMCGGDFKNAFDGKLEFQPDHDCFLLFYNTKHDHLGEHHPRTRFSVAHELGHFYLEAHNAYLRSGGVAHGSRSEFSSDVVIEQEADAFGAGLLLPSSLIGPRVNLAELTMRTLKQLATDFRTSLVSTSIRAVALSHFPCAVVAIQEGTRTWAFQSDCMIDAGCYPGERGKLPSETARAQWASFAKGNHTAAEAEGFLRDWFRTYDNDRLEHVRVTEEYLPVPVMELLLVLVTADETDLLGE